MEKFESTATLKRILREYFQSFFPEEGPAPKVAWCTSVGPAEILVSLGFQVYYPENHGALLGATRQSNRYIQGAHSKGYSPDICSYLTSDVGAFMEGQTPLTKTYGIPSIPKPDVLVYNTNQCREVQDWFSFYAREFDVPALGIFSPWKVDQVSNEQVDCVKEQFKTLIKSLAPISPEVFDPERLRQVLALSDRSSKLWGEFLSKAKAAPAPASFFDGCIHMAPAVVLRGLESAPRYYEELNREVDQRLAQGISAVRNERLRLYWEGMPIWGKLRFFSELFDELDANVVASTYCNSWIFDAFDMKDPLESMARAYTEIFINRSENAKEENLRKMSHDYGVDGIIYHDAKTCPYNSNSRFGLPQRLCEKSKIPFLVIQGDLNDLRCFSEEQTSTSIEAFVDQLTETEKSKCL
jgi:benzoyl-CoA reductase/2-hydroxyglutaryl-CoA dehydratase subunit BcrC/BadD/HgdB